VIAHGSSGRTLAVAIGFAAAATIGRVVAGVPHGLQAEYFTGVDRTGSPAFSVVDDNVSTDQLANTWRGNPPPAFSARWHGYLAVGRAGLYRFATTSDDGSWLYVDNRLIVDNAGTHSAVTQSGEVWLTRGSHFVLLEYVQAGGLYSMEWSWAGDGAGLTRVPNWILSPRRLSYAAALTAHAMDWVWWLSMACVAGATAIAFRGLRWDLPAVVQRRTKRVSLALFVGLAMLHTWPLALDLSYLSRNDNGDTILNEWTLAWVAHQAPRVPVDWARGRPYSLYDANIFYPEKRTLAYSEALVVQAAMGAPLLWAGASPVLTYNVLLIAGFALTGWAMCLVLAAWTGDWVAAVAGGVLMGFNAHTLTHMPHLQAQHVEFLPFALLALDRLLAEPRVSRALSLALWFTLQALTSFYLLVMTTVALVGATAARPEAWTRPRAVRVLASLIGAAIMAFVVLLPFLLPYWHVSHDQGFTRSLEEVAGFTATWRDYLTTPGRLARVWPANQGSASPMYPGAVGTALALVAILSGIALRDPRPRMCLVFGICGVLLSFGPDVPGYGWLYQVFPPLQGIRAVSRFGYLGLVAVAVVGAYGVVCIRSWMRHSPWRRPASFCILALVAIEPLAAPISYMRFGGIPRIYARLADEPSAVVAEFPMPMSRGVFFNAPYMLNSTIHWKPLINGYSGFVPASYHEHLEQLRDFPGPRAIAALQRMGVTHVFAHTSELGPATSRDLGQVPALERLAEEGDIVLYRLAPQAERR